MGQYYNFGDQFGPLLQQAIARAEQSHQFDEDQAFKYMQFQELQKQHKETMQMDERKLGLQQQQIDIDKTRNDLEGRRISLSATEASSKFLEQYMNEDAVTALGLDPSKITPVDATKVNDYLRSAYGDQAAQLQQIMRSNKIASKSFVDAVIGVESGGNNNASNPNSTATGAGQFIDATWLSMVKKYAPEKAAGKTDAEILAMRSDGDLSRLMVQKYSDENAAYLTKGGVDSPTPGQLYLAHFLGPQGALKVIQNSDSKLSDILPDSTISANKSVFDKLSTGSDLANWADSKMSSVASAQENGNEQPIRYYSKDLVGALKERAAIDRDNAARDAMQEKKPHPIEGLNEIPAPTVSQGETRSIRGSIPVAPTVWNELKSKMQISPLSKFSLNASETNEYLRKKIPALFENYNPETGRIDNTGEVSDIGYDYKNNAITFTRKYREAPDVAYKAAEVADFIKNSLPRIGKSISQMTPSELRNQEAQLVDMGGKLGALSQAFPQYAKELSPYSAWFKKYMEQIELEKAKLAQKSSAASASQQLRMLQMLMQAKDPNALKFLQENSGVAN